MHGESGKFHNRCIGSRRNFSIGTFIGSQGNFSFWCMGNLGNFLIGAWKAREISQLVHGMESQGNWLCDLN